MLTRRGYAAISSVLFFTLSSSLTLSYPFVVTALILLVLLSIDFVLFRLSANTFDRLDLTRNVSADSVLVGDGFSYDLVLTSKGSGTLGPMVIHDLLPENIDLLTGGSTIGSVRPWAPTSLRRSVEAVEMGDAQFGEVEVRLFDRLGLLWTKRVFNLKSVVKIYPTIRQAVRRNRRGRRLFHRSMGRVVWRRRLLSEFAGMREYYPGDDHRLIAWKAMAKSPTSTPLTKELEEEIDADVVIIVANRKSMADGEKGSRKIDKAVEAALALAREVSRAGHKTSVAFYHNGVPKIASGSTIRLSQQMYNMGFHSNDDVDLLLRAVMRMRGRPGLAILLIDSPYPKEIDSSPLVRLMLAKFALRVLLLDTSTFFDESKGPAREGFWAMDILGDRERLHQGRVADRLIASRIPVRTCGSDDLVDVAVETFLESQQVLRR
ncbi:MAG: DUF58 domain-containing protein [Thaumarchaeota archaeon]|nr:DUF58 domain-containing protein [Nitrososphaerota archaeon]